MENPHGFAAKRVVKRYCDVSEGEPVGLDKSRITGATERRCRYAPKQ